MAPRTAGSTTTFDSISAQSLGGRQDLRKILERVMTSVRALLVWGLAVMAGCQSEGITRDWRRVEPPVAAPEFTLPTLEGGSVSLSSLRGHVVILEFWATWCGPCRGSLPSLETVYKRERARGVSVLLINQGEPVEKIRPWVGRRFTAPMLLDADGTVGRRYRVQGIPRLFIVDTQGRIVYEHSGYGGGLERNLRLILDDLLPSQQPARVLK